MSVTTSPFLNMVREEIRLRGYSFRTEKSYLFWIKQFILFHGKRHPNEMGANEVKAFLTWLAVKQGCNNRPKAEVGDHSIVQKNR